MVICVMGWDHLVVAEKHMSYVGINILWLTNKVTIKIRIWDNSSEIKMS